MSLMTQTTCSGVESLSPVDCQFEFVKQPRFPAARDFMQKLQAMLEEY